MVVNAKICVSISSIFFSFKFYVKFSYRSQGKGNSQWWVECVSGCGIGGLKGDMAKHNCSKDLCMESRVLVSHQSVHPSMSE